MNIRKLELSHFGVESRTPCNSMENHTEVSVKFVIETIEELLKNSKGKFSVSKLKLKAKIEELKTYLN
jgi:hypothetical protein